VWQQAATPCESPEVTLTTRAETRLAFSLTLKSRCAGASESTSLAGAWEWAGQSEVKLVFPNTSGGTDESLACVFDRCKDEDCLRCGAGSEMEFLVLPVRR
jgi:hypothetical protein